MDSTTEYRALLGIQSKIVIAHRMLDQFEQAIANDDLESAAASLMVAHDYASEAYDLYLTLPYLPDTQQEVMDVLEQCGLMQRFVNHMIMEFE